MGWLKTIVNDCSSSFVIALNTSKFGIWSVELVNSTLPILNSVFPSTLTLNT